MLGAAGAFAAAESLLLAASNDLQNPARQVEDRGSSIKINALKAHRVGTKAYLKIETDRKIFGWGEVTGLDPNVACALARSLFELLDGENPTRIEYLWQKIYRAHRNILGGITQVKKIASLAEAFHVPLAPHCTMSEIDY